MVDLEKINGRSRKKSMVDPEKYIVDPEKIHDRTRKNPWSIQKKT